MKWLRTKARELAARLLGRDIGRVSCEAFDDAEVISFDMFDTLVYRCCGKPSDVFEIVERRYNDMSGEHGLRGFREARVRAEGAARGERGSEEVTIREIYESLPAGLQPAADELMALEIDTELALCRPVPEAKGLFETALRLGKRVVVTSDMYLPREVVEGILANCGYRGQSGVFVSSEYGLTKRSGHLFEAVAAGLGVGPSRLLHIGDHPAGDYLAARRAGLSAFLYRRPVRRTRLFRPWKAVGAEAGSLDSLEIGVIESVVQEGLRHYSEVRERFGFAVLGPMLYGYTTWLHALKEGLGTDDLWFLSREGCVLRRAYLALYEDEADVARYLNVSRVALCRAVAGRMKSYPELMSLLSCLSNSIVTIGDLLTVLGIEDRCGLGERGLSEDDALGEQDGGEVFEAVMSLGGQSFREQEALATEYLRCGKGSEGRAVVCDIGWAGTMQALLQMLLPEMGLSGAYLAVSDFHDGERLAIDRAALDRKGYWCGSSEWGTRGQAIRFVQSAAETLFLNPEGTTLGYRRGRQGVEPVRVGGRQLGETEASAAMLQRGAMAFVAECADMRLAEVLGGIDSLSAMLPFLNGVTRGSREAVRFYRYFRFADGARVASITPERGLSYYLAHPSDARAELEANNSKVLWLKGVFRVPLPYFQLLRALTSGLGLKSDYARSIENVA